MKYLLIYIFVLFLTGYSYSQGTGEYEIRTNQEIYSKLTDRNLEKLENKLVILGKEKVFCLVITGKDEYKDFLYTRLKQRFYNYRIITEKDSTASDYVITIGDIDFKTRYNKIFGSIIKNKKVEREIRITFVSEIKQKNSTDVLFNERITDKSTDDFLLDRLEQVERGDYGFLKGTLPERSFFEKAVIPGVVILASAVTIVLFFIIRSK